MPGPDPIVALWLDEGEVCFASPALMDGYYRLGSETAAVPEIPRTPATGQVQRRRLREQVAMAAT